MSSEEHRRVLTRAIGDDLPVTLLKQDPSYNVYVGLWSVWWSFPEEMAGIKVVLVTVPRNASIPEKSTLRSLPWSIMQLQTLIPDDRIWGDITKALRTDIDAAAISADKPCSGGSISYEAMQKQKQSLQRSVQHPESLQEYIVTRQDDTVSLGPKDAIDRRRIPYAVYRGRPEDLRAQPLRVFIEKHVPKRAQVSQHLHSESGLSKDSTLLSAISEWRTWIILTDR